MGFTLSPQRSLRWGRFLWLFIGVALIGYAVVFTLWVFFGETMELGLGAAEVGATRDEIRAIHPALMHYIDHLHVALGGFMAGLGIAIVGLAWFGLRARQRWSLWVMVTAAAVALVVSTPMHHLHGFDTFAHMGAVYPGIVLGGIATWLAQRGLEARCLSISRNAYIYPPAPSLASCPRSVSPRTCCSDSTRQPRQVSPFRC